MRRIVAITVAALILSILADLFFQGHGNFPWSSSLGFYAVFGLVGCIAIVLISKWLGHYWLQRKEDYWGDRDE